MSGNSYWCFKWPEDSLAEVHTEHDHMIGSLSHKVTHLWKQNENKNKISKWEKGEGRAFIYDKWVQFFKIEIMNMVGRDLMVKQQ